MAFRANSSALDLHSLPALPSLPPSLPPPQQPWQHTGSCNTKVQTKSAPKICLGGSGNWALSQVSDLEWLVGLCLERESRGRGCSSSGRLAFHPRELHSHQNPTLSPQSLRLMDSPGSSQSHLWRLLHCTQAKRCNSPVPGAAWGRSQPDGREAISLLYI